MPGTQASEATPFCERLCPGMTEKQCSLDLRLRVLALELTLRAEPPQVLRGDGFE